MYFGLLCLKLYICAFENVTAFLKTLHAFPHVTTGCNTFDYKKFDYKKFLICRIATSKINSLFQKNIAP